ncbi:MAG: hypothetical protein AB7F96_21075 [Beijerinckiaceae bacterium]
MFLRTSLLFAALAAVPALAQQPGDPKFCRQYAETAATAAADAIAINRSCLNFSSGVHDNREDHFRWCSRTPREKVEGAATHIRRLASRCTNGALAEATEYGGYDIAGNERFERPYGRARQWEVKAAYSGRTFMYCVASPTGTDRQVRLGFDLSMPGESGQWQLAVPGRVRKDWQGRLEIDGKEPGNRAGADVSGNSRAGWAIAWLNMGQVDALRQGTNANLGIGKADYDFSLAGIAAAITKIEECRQRRGATMGAANQPARAPQLSVAAAAPAALPVSGPEPAELIDGIYRSAMAGSNPFDKRTRGQYLSRQLLGLIVRDERESARKGEPGKLDYDLLSGAQDMLKIGGLQVTEVSRQQDRVNVRVRFRNTAFKGRAPVETVIYQLQAGNQGWRITNIIYNAQQNLLATLTR